MNWALNCCIGCQNPNRFILISTKNLFDPFIFDIRNFCVLSSWTKNSLASDSLFTKHQFKMDLICKLTKDWEQGLISISNTRFPTSFIKYEFLKMFRYKQDVICQGEGPVHNIRWRGRFAAWITDKVNKFNQLKLISALPSS